MENSRTLLHDGSSYQTFPYGEQNSKLQSKSKTVPTDNSSKLTKITAIDDYDRIKENEVNEQLYKSKDSFRLADGDEASYTDNSLLISTNEQLHRYHRRIRRLMITDLLCLSASFMLVYMAFVSLQTLQSSLNSREGLGVASLCWIYSASVVSCLLAPLLMRYFTTKWTILIGFTCFLLYLLTNLYPVYFVILPASLFYGLTFGPMWSAQSTHLTSVAIRYGSTFQKDTSYCQSNTFYNTNDNQLQDMNAKNSNSNNCRSSFDRSCTPTPTPPTISTNLCSNPLGMIALHPHENIITMFNAIFCSIFQTCHLWGNLMSSMLLFQSTNTTAHISRHLINYTRQYCGAKNCARNAYDFPWTYDEFYAKNQQSKDSQYVNNSYAYYTREEDGVWLQSKQALPHHLHPISNDTRLILLTLYVVCVVIGIVLLYWKLDNLQMYSSGSKKTAVSSRKLLFDTIRMFGDPKFQLLLPLVVFAGLQQAFIQGDFTMAYVRCTLGIYSIGTAMISYGVISALGSFVIAWFSQQIKRFHIMAAGTIFSSFLFICLLLWKPRHDDMAMFYVIAACLGICDAIWQTQTSTLFAVVFSEKKEAAFASYRLLQALGLAIGFGYSYFLCVSTKLYIVSSFFGVGIFLYAVLEYQIKQESSTIVITLL